MKENFAEQQNELEKLPENLDVPGTIFAYGALLIPEELAEGAGVSPDRIHTASDLDEAQNIRSENPESIVILRNVEIDNIRTSIIHEKMLDKHAGEEIERMNKHLKGEVDFDRNDPENEHQLYLMSRKAEENQAGKTLRGGLIIGLSDEQLKRIDTFEMAMEEDASGEPFERQVYKRSPVEEVNIGDSSYDTEHVEFYEGVMPEGEVHDDETAKQTQKLLADARKELRESYPQLEELAQRIRQSQTEKELKRAKEVLRKKLDNMGLNWPAVRNDPRKPYYELLELSLDDLPSEEGSPD